jgi:hypothetical protein
METEAEQAMMNVPEIGLENRLVAEKSAANRKRTSRIFGSR